MKIALELIGHIAFACVFLGAICFLLFGQITVRKLRKNPATRDYLGLVWQSGGDIYSTAMVLTMPKFLSKRRQRSRFPSLVPNPEVLRAHTTRLDRFLGKSLFTLWTAGTLLIFLDIFLNQIGIK